jgi:hypothetical protein
MFDNKKNLLDINVASYQITLDGNGILNAFSPPAYNSIITSIIDKSTLQTGTAFL